MSNIIYDNNTYFRFQIGMKVHMALSDNDNLEYNIKGCIETGYICCSLVKITRTNWFYHIPNSISDKKLLVKWLEEISPLFPNFKIDIVKYNPRLGTTRLILRESDKIYIKLPDSFMKSLNLESPNIYLSNVLTIVEDLIIYYINNNINISDYNNKELIQEYIEKYFSNIILSIKKLRTITTYVDKKANYFNTNTFISLIEHINKSDLYSYISSILKDNSTNISSYFTTVTNIRENDHLQTEERIRALYKYKDQNDYISSYLAHHLIRAGLSRDFEDYIKQYFLIKEKTPGLYFWNRIFLTQFGFNYYYYYWLTSNRTFRFTNEEEFNNKIKETTDSSSLQFFNQFIIKFPTTVLSYIIKLYKEGDFDKLIPIFESKLVVELLPNNKEKFKNLRLSDIYTVLSTQDNYYYITGDDFITRRYSKLNFKLLK